MVAELHGIISMEVVSLQKAEWLSAYIRAHTSAFSLQNIRSAFNGASLFPFNPSKVIRRHTLSASASPSPLSTPETTSPFDNPVLTSYPNDITMFHHVNSELIQPIDSVQLLPSPERRHIHHLV